jgi:hypothetical protein
MRDLFFFDKMVTPKLITIIYWLLLVLSVFIGLGVMFGNGGFSFGNLLLGIFSFVGSVVVSRVWCELLILMFKMNEALQDIRNK